jgi:hypothetical protein
MRIVTKREKSPFLVMFTLVTLFTLGWAGTASAQDASPTLPPRDSGGQVSAPASPSGTTPQRKEGEAGKQEERQPSGTKDKEAEPAPTPAPPCTPISGSTEAYWAIFKVITTLFAAMLVLLIALVIFASVNQNWSIAKALSEECRSQPKEITKDNLIMIASSSRLIALFGLAGILTIVLGFGYAAIRHLVMCGNVPDLSGVRNFLFGSATLFAPYLANQVREAFTQARTGKQGNGASNKTSAGQQIAPQPAPPGGPAPQGSSPPPGKQP